MAAHVTTPAPHDIDSNVVYAIEEALIQHTNSVAAAKQEWRKATHPRLKPSQATIAQANERYRIAYTASLRVYLGVIRDIDDRS